MDCLFCKIVNGEIPSYTLYEDEYVKCYLDINPISTSHCLIIPKKHFKDIYDIESEYLLKINECAKNIIKLIDEKFKPDGYRLVQNNGNLQEVKHYHLHIIPSYINEDKNNLSVNDIYDILRK